jgi:hypothetical protein
VSKFGYYSQNVKNLVLSGAKKISTPLCGPKKNKNLGSDFQIFQNFGYRIGPKTRSGRVPITETFAEIIGGKIQKNSNKFTSPSSPQNK